MDFCIYTTHHPKGYFYLGKASTASIESGKYRGSGAKLRKYFKKYPPREWTTEIVKRGLTETGAFEAEARFVTEDMLKVEGCLNLKTGGFGGFQASPELKARLCVVQNDPEVKERAKASKVASQNKPAVKASKSKSMKAFIAANIDDWGSKRKKAMANPETRAKLRTAALANWAKRKGELSSRT